MCDALLYLHESEVQKAEAAFTYLCSCMTLATFLIKQKRKMETTQRWETYTN